MSLTDGQMRTLEMVHRGMSTRLMRYALGLKSTAAVRSRLRTLQAKGVINSKETGFLPAWHLTSAGLALVNRRRCRTCDGEGHVPA